MEVAKRKYRRVSCHDNKTAAKKKQKKMHDSGKTARLVKNGKKWCIESAGNRKKTGGRKTQQRKRS